LAFADKAGAAWAAKLDEKRTVTPLMSAAINKGFMSAPRPFDPGIRDLSSLSIGWDE
jgi:hypothetical protein